MGDRESLSSAFQVLDEIVAAARGGRVVVFLDYDGTLTPIVALPEQAVLDDGMRATVAALADVADVAIVSGRDLEDVRAHVRVQGITYAGSHGFDVQERDGARVVLGGGEAYLEALDAAESALREAVVAIDGAWVDRKRFGIAVHYRQVPEEREGEVRDLVEGVAARFASLRVGGGKKVHELRPATDWHKGALVSALLDRAEEACDGPVAAVYLGDDVTDEDAFRALIGRGTGVFVGERRAASETAARARLHDVAEVRVWLDALRARLVAGAG